MVNNFHYLNLNQITDFIKQNNHPIKEQFIWKTLIKLLESGIVEKNTKGLFRLIPLSKENKNLYDYYGDEPTWSATVRFAQNLLLPKGRWRSTR